MTNFNNIFNYYKLKSPRPNGDFKNGNFFNTIFTLNSAANIANPKHLNLLETLRHKYRGKNKEPLE